ncbi:MAG: HEAT repeat domain-containing protein, partial [Planctomycetota bacterium]
DKEVISAPEVAVVTAESISIGDASPANLVDFARPPIGTVEVDIPAGNSPEEIAKLIGLFQFPVPQANRDAQAQLVSIGLPAVPQLITALGDWDNKTFNQALSVLARIGDPALPLVLDALDHEELYVRYNCRVLIGRMKGGRFTGLFERRADGSGMIDPREQRRELAEAMLPGLSMPNALDRRSAAEAIAALWVGEDAPPELRTMLRDADPDVVVAAADALSHLGVTDAIPDLEDALLRAFFVETRRDLAVALAGLGSTAGIQDLFTGLDHEDDLIRESMFESFFAVTGLWFGYDPFAPRPERLAAISDLQAYWAEVGGPEKLRKAFRPDPGKAERAWSLVKNLSGLVTNQAADARIIDELVSLRKDAQPALFAGLKYPAGFAGKLALVCDTLALIGDRDAAPYLAAMLRSPVIAVTIRAAQALEKAGDAAAIPALVRYRDRIHSVEARGELPPRIGSRELILAWAARTRLMLGDESAREELIELLLCDDRAARAEAIQALAEKYGEARGFDPDASAAERQAAVRAWQAR